MSGWYRIPKGEGWRLMRIGDGMIESLGSRTNEGHAIHGEWGEPDRYGVYEPTFTVDYTDLTPAVLLRDDPASVERLARAAQKASYAFGTPPAWADIAYDEQQEYLEEARAIIERLRGEA